MENTISIILFLTDNHSVNLEKVLADLETQTFQNIEVIVCCNNEDIQIAPQIQLSSKYNISFIAASSLLTQFLDKAVNISKGKYIVFLNEYSILLPECLQILFDFMELHPQTDVCGNYVKYKKDNQFLVHTSPIDHFQISCQLLLKNPITPWSTIIRKEKLVRLFTDDSFDYCDVADDEQEHDIFYLLWVNLMIYCVHFRTLPETLSEYNNKLPSPPYETDLLIKNRYFEFISGLIVEYNPVFNITFDSLIDACNEDELSFYRLIEITVSIYKQAYINKKHQDAGQKKKILICMQHLGRGGAEKLLVDILQLFDYQKYHIDLLLLYPVGHYYRSLPEEVDCFSLSDSSLHLLNSYDVEIAFLEGPCTKYIAKRKNNAKKIAWVHVDFKEFHWTKSSFKEGEEELSYLKFDNIVFVSENAKKQFNKIFSSLSINQDIIYPLIDKTEISYKANLADLSKQEDLVICSVGSLTTIKGYQRLISVVYQLLKEDFKLKLWIIGEGPLEEELQSMINKNHLQDCVKLMGYKQNPYSYMKVADIFISVSFSEGFSLVIAEALSLGKPIFATRTAGATELLDNGKFGLLVENNESEIYNGLKKMLQDKELRDRLAVKAKQRAEIFDKEKSMNSIYNLLESEQDITI